MSQPSPRQPDLNRTAADLVREATGQEPVRAEELFGDPKLREEFERLKQEVNAATPNTSNCTQR